MARGLPYDSDAGRAYAAAITALMYGEAYAQSARIAAAMGPFAGYAKNREPMLRVIDKHRDARQADRRRARAARAAAGGARGRGTRRSRWASSTATATARSRCSRPTGTIGFMMDCDTTGIEPDIALVKYKKLVGGGMMKIVNQTVPRR